MSARTAPRRWTIHYTEALSKTLLDGQAERVRLICGSGVGASVAASRWAFVPGSVTIRIRPTRESNTTI